MKKTLLALLSLVLLASCNETGGGDTPTIDPSNKNANTWHSGKHATRIEIPAIESGDLFLSHTTTVNGKENITYSIYAPSLRDTGMVSSATGYLDFMSYMAAAISSTIFSRSSRSEKLLALKIMDQ